MCWKRRANIHWFCERIRLYYFPSQTRFETFGCREEKEKSLQGVGMMTILIWQRATIISFWGCLANRIFHLSTKTNEDFFGVECELLTKSWLPKW